MTSCDGDSGWVEVDVKNRFAVGDELELLTPSGNRRFRLEALCDGEGNPMDVAPGAGYRVLMPAPLVDCDMGLVTRLL